MTSGQLKQKRAREKQAKALTPKQKLFVREYPKDLNATQAVIRSGYSKTGAAVMGHSLLTNPKIQKALSSKVDEKLQKADMGFDELVQESVAIATSRVGDLFNPETWQLCKPSELPDEVQAAISGVEVVVQPDGSAQYKYRFWPKGQALEFIAKLKGLVTKKVEVEDKSWREILRQMDEEDQAKP